MVQELINQLFDIKRENHLEYNKKYNEILYKLIENETVYALLSKTTTSDQLKADTANLYCTRNSFGNPSFWMFSEEKLALGCAEKNGFYIKPKFSFGKKEYLIKKLDIKQMMTIGYNAIFSGVTDIILDEGANCIGISSKDLVNSVFIRDGEEILIKNEDYNFITLFNRMKLNNEMVYIIASETSNFDEIFKYEFVPDFRDEKLKIFTNENTAKAYAKKELKSDFYAVATNIYQFNKIFIKMFQDKLSYGVKFVEENNQYELDFTRVLGLMNKML